MSDERMNKVREALESTDRACWSALVEGAVRQMSSGASEGVLMNLDSSGDSTEIVAATFYIGLGGTRIHLIVAGESEVQPWFDRLAVPAGVLDLTVQAVSAEQSMRERQAAWRAPVVVCAVRQLLQDRAHDLGRWPIPRTASHRQFDRLYGRRSSQQNQLVVEAEQALLPNAERVLIDGLAMKAALKPGAAHAAGGELHLYGLLSRYPRLSGVGRFSPAERREIRRYYGVKVTGRPAPMSSAVVFSNRQAQFAELLDRVVECGEQGVPSEVCSEDQALLDEIEAVLTATADHEFECRFHKGFSALENALRDADDTRHILIVDGRGPSAVRLVRHRLDPEHRYRWSMIYSPEDELITGQISPVGVWLMQSGFKLGLSGLMSRLVVWLACRAERRRRQAFLDHLDVVHRRFAFTRVGYFSSD